MATTMMSGLLPLAAESGRIAVLPYFYIFPRFRPNPNWTFSQSVRLLLIKWFLHLAYAFNLRPPMSMDPEKEGDQWEVVDPATLVSGKAASTMAAHGIRFDSNPGADSLTDQLYSGPLRSSTIKPEPVGVTWFPSRPPSSEQVPKDADVVLHFHGGGYVIGDGRESDAGFLARGILRNTKVKYVASVQYRLASYPGGYFPAPLQDALTCYIHLITQIGVRPERITISGDSAGGNMVLGLLRFLMTAQARRLGIPQPGCAWLWSPLVDVGMAGDTTFFNQSPNKSTDFITEGFAKWCARLIPSTEGPDPSSGDGAATGPYLSPQRYPFKTPVPMFVHVGGTEVLYHGIIDVYRRYTRGVDTVTPEDDPARFGMTAAYTPQSPPMDFFDAVVGPVAKEGPNNNMHLCVSELAPHDIALVGHILDFKPEYYRCAALAGKFLEANRLVRASL